MSQVTVHRGDSRDVLKTLADASIDSCVTDPPYALVSIGKRFGKDGAAPCKAGKTGAYQRASAGFMGAKWDTGETAFDPDFWAEVFRVLKPGAHLIAFSGTRTYHRMVCAIEDAGFEIRDQIGWVFGSGFPKSHDVSKGIDRAAGAERQKTGEVHRASIQHNGDPRGAFASHPEDTKRVEITGPATEAAALWEGWGTALKPAWEPICVARKPLDGTVAGNVLKHGTGALNIDGSRVDMAGEVVTTGQGTSDSIYGGGRGLRPAEMGTQKFQSHTAGRWPANLIHDGSDEVVACFPDTNSGSMKAGTRRAAQDAPGSVVYGVYGGDATSSDTPGDSGSAARFFYSAKADAEDRLGSKHPTVKPVDLMAYLCRLVTPPNGVILDPFAGSGTTGLAAMREGFDCILIEREAQYVADIERRLAWARGEGRLTAQETSRSKTDEHPGPLFGDAA